MNPPREGDEILKMPPVGPKRPKRRYPWPPGLTTANINLRIDHSARKEGN